jgi:hypothetical protein
MADHRGEYRVEKMAGNLGETRSGFYAWLRRGKGPDGKRTSSSGT